MTSPIVHIGFHKTATSWFQTAIYPQLTSHRYIDRDIVRDLFMRGDAFDFDPVRTRLALEVDGEALPPLICEEDLSGILHVGLASSYIAKEMARRIHATIPESEILMFVRSQYTAAYSWYSQYLREGGTVSLKRYLFPDEYIYAGKSTSFKTARFNLAQLEYKGLIEEYDLLFGRERVHVFTYEDLARNRGSILDTIERRLLIEGGLNALSGRGLNMSYRRGLLPIARMLNIFTGRAVPNKWALVHVPRWYGARRVILDTLNKLPLFGGRPNVVNTIDRHTLARIAEEFWESNRWLAQRLNRDLGALGYPVDPPANGMLQPVRSPLVRWARR